MNQTNSTLQAFFSFSSIKSQAFLPDLLSRREIKSEQKLVGKNLTEVMSVFLGVCLLAALAQIAVPLPFTPVPVTGQTFGISLVALLWGRRLAFTTVASYVLAGGLGLPIFAMAKSGLIFGPTLGYLLGMMLSSWVVGGLADLGWTRSFFKAWLACAIGSVCVFSCGLAGLSFFIPASKLLMAGFFPFLPGDIIKSVAAAAIVSRKRIT